MAQESAFRNVADKWLVHWQNGKSARHVDSTSRRLAANILPFLGDKLVTEITAPQLVAMVKAIQDRGARDIAKRALETTGQIFRFAVAYGFAERNPAADVRPLTCSRRRSKRTTRVLTQRNCLICSAKCRSILVDT